ncbi:MATE family efflux transporter [Blautia hydrogenotrophica]|uniref:MATE family efflux transporter n=1 Tax=Blautia hydrogenotrophica TaxID=53443 RepID=UPI003AB3069C
MSKKTDLLGVVPVKKALLAMGVPTMTGMLINALYNLADAYFVGNLGTEQMGAISIAFPLGQAVVGLGLLFGSGAASYISRLLGRREREKAGRVASTALYGSIFTGMAVIVLTLLCLKPILKALGATETILPYAVTYAEIYVLSSVFNVFNVTMNSIVTSEGAAKTTMFALLAGAVLNVILDPVLIYSLDLGVAGAAAATGISQIFTSLIYMNYILRKKSLFTFSIKKCCLSKKTMTEIFKIGIPTMVFQLLTSLASALINMQSREYGDSVIAGMGTVTRIVSMGSLMVFGFVKGFQPIAGYSYGAGNYGRLQETVRTAILWSTVFCVAFGTVLAIFPAPIVACFTAGDIEMIHVGSCALRANGISFLLFGFYTVYSSLYLALGRAGKGFVLGACRQGICFIPLIFVLPVFMGENGIFYAQPVADVFAAGAALFAAVEFRKELNYRWKGEREE